MNETKLEAISNQGLIGFTVDYQVRNNEKGFDESKKGLIMDKVRVYGNSTNFDKYVVIDEKGYAEVIYPEHITRVHPLEIVIRNTTEDRKEEDDDGIKPLMSNWMPIAESPNMRGGWVRRIQKYGRNILVEVYYDIVGNLVAHLKNQPDGKTYLEIESYRNI